MGKAVGRVALAALALVATLLVAMRLGTASSTVRLVTLPGGTESRWAAHVLDEEAVSVAGALALMVRWPLTTGERRELVPAMRQAYVEMRRQRGVTPSPVVDTLLARQRPSGFDAVVIEPLSGKRARAGVIFLHGYAGSFTFECWLASEAAREIEAVTVCPAVDFAGHWSGRDGERTLRETLAWLHGRGVEQLFLVGLSNGAVGASALAPRLAPQLAGLVLISGAPAQGSSGGLPALVVHGEQDALASAGHARTFAARTGARYAGFAGGHFVLLLRREETRATIGRWLREHR
jgi:pimeloyl-ACP methyl ester carboxylesterase